MCLDLPLVCLDIDRAIATETCRWKYLHISDVFRLTFLFLAVPVQKEKEKKRRQATITTPPTIMMI